FGAFVAIRIGDGEKKAADSGATHLGLGREIGTAKERFAVGKKEACERPAALSGNGTDGGRVARINVGALVAVDSHGDEMLVDDFRELGVLVGIAGDDGAPVAPRGTDIEAAGLVVGCAART